MCHQGHPGFSRHLAPRWTEGAAGPGWVAPEKPRAPRAGAGPPPLPLLPEPRGLPPRGLRCPATHQAPGWVPTAPFLHLPSCRAGAAGTEVTPRSLWPHAGRGAGRGLGVLLPLGALDPALGGTSQLSSGDTAGSLQLCGLRVLQRSRWKGPCWVSPATPLNRQGLELPGREGVLSEHLGQLAPPGLRLPPQGLGPAEPRRSGLPPESQPVPAGPSGRPLPLLCNMPVMTPQEPSWGRVPNSGARRRAGCSPARGARGLLWIDPAGGWRPVAGPWEEGDGPQSWGGTPRANMLEAA